MGEKLYYVFKIIKEAREPISAKDILKRLENYEIFLDIKTVYSLIKKLNDFYYCLSNKQLIKTIRRRGYIIDEDFLSRLGLNKTLSINSCSCPSSKKSSSII